MNHEYSKDILQERLILLKCFQNLMGKHCILMEFNTENYNLLIAIVLKIRQLY